MTLRTELLALLLLLAPPALAQEPAPPPAQPDPAPAQALPADAQGLEPGLYARLQTNLGVMILRLEPERAPMTTANFVGLIEGTKEWTDAQTGEKHKRPYYDGLIFHRIIAGFMIQGGCPLGTGTGGPGYQFPDEFHPALRHDRAGILSMANAGPGTNGSQFFITLGPTPHLDDRHSIFGHVVRGQDVLERLGKVQTGPQDRPVEPVKIEKATVVRVGPEAGAWSAGEHAFDPAPKPVGPCEVEADPARVPGAEQPEQSEVRVRLICVQYKGAHRCAPHVSRTKEEALERARQILPHARAKGADMDALTRRWSDMPSLVYPLVKGRTDPTFAAAFKLQKGQVSDPVETPFGVIIFEGQ
jgi:cyclophilin family peptidyl-prolyl cis-trans isomerase